MGGVPAESAVVIRSSLSAVVLNRKAIDVPSAGWVGSDADGNVQVIGAGETLGKDIGTIQREHDMEPALGLGIEEATWIGNGGAKLCWVLCSADGGVVAVEAVEGNGTSQ